MKTIKEGQTEIIVTDLMEPAHIILKKGSKLVYVIIAHAHNDGKTLISFELAGEHSEAQFYGFVVGRGKKSFRIETVARHTAPRSISRFYLREAMFDGSSLDYKGNLRIEREAQQSDAHLSSRSLLLSADAHVNSVPALEILADDVKAGHSATIGRLDEESLFYLYSRGLDKKTAEHMMINAFFASQTRMIEDAKTRKTVEKKISQLIPSYV